MNKVKRLYSPFQPTLTPHGLTHLGFHVRYWTPSGLLNEFVYSFLQIESEGHSFYPMIPDGTQALFFSKENMIVGGAQQTAQTLSIAAAGDYFGIWFNPLALHRLFLIDANDITNQFVNSDFLPFSSLLPLHEKMYQVTEFSQRVALCQQWLASLLFSQYDENRWSQSTNYIHHALTLIYQSMGTIRVSQLANSVGCSSRHLNRLFQQYIGMNTKAFLQTIRLQFLCRKLYAEKANYNQPCYSELAYEFGFSDQPHLIKQFQTQLFSTPNAFLQEMMSDFYNR
ncbi:AraC family transcriptional regulator [Marinomonas agarivorans]|nr:AraC family transcriptional regulator [Marinomonas agarivorans]